MSLHIINRLLDRRTPVPGLTLQQKPPEPSRAERKSWIAVLRRLRTGWSVPLATMADIDVKKLTIADLKKELNARSVAFPSGALKAALQTLLADALAKEKEEKSAPVAAAPVAATPAPAKPAPTPVVASAKPVAPAPATTASVAAPVAAEEASAPAQSSEPAKPQTEAEKALARAKKFGLPTKVDDPARVSKRKEKFGTFTEDDKKSQRAERFQKQVQMTVADKDAVVRRAFFKTFLPASALNFYDGLSFVFEFEIACASSLAEKYICFSGRSRWPPRARRPPNFFNDASIFRSFLYVLEISYASCLHLRHCS